MDPIQIKDARSIWIGFDPREAAAFAVCRHSIKQRTNICPPVRGVILNELREQGLYTRPTEYRNGQLWDVISEAPCSTEFAISRFLVPHLARQMFKKEESAGWALFMDCDILARDSVNKLFAAAKSKYAVMVVKHVHEPDYHVKMDGQAQTRYPKKNWSSVVLYNCDHPANDALTVEMINTLPGRELHQFCWLKDEEIGELDPCWNYLVGHTQTNDEPKLVHFTDGPPTMRGYEDCEYADEFWDEMDRWAA